MYIVSDETGPFESERSGDFCLITIVTLPDIECKLFEEWLKREFPENVSSIKGNTNLPIADRLKIIKYIQKRPDIKYACIALDLGLSKKSDVEYHQNGILEKLDEYIGVVRKVNPSNISLVKDISLLKNQIKKLKRVDFIKFYMWAILYIDWYQFSQFDYVNLSIKRDSWDMHHIIDTQSKSTTFVKLLTAYVKMTTTMGVNNYRVYSPKEWSLDHPYNKKYGTEKGIDGKIFYKDFKIGDDKSELILKLPDIIGNTLFKSINKVTAKELLKIVKRLKGNRTWMVKKLGESYFYKMIRLNKEANYQESKLSKHYGALKNL